MKLTKHAWSLWGCSLAAVLAAALLIPFRKTGGYWLALGCLPLMFALCALVFVRAFSEKDTLESKLLGWPLFKVAFFAVAGEACLALLLMAFSTLCPLWLGGIAGDPPLCRRRGLPRGAGRRRENYRSKRKHPHRHYRRVESPPGPCQRLICWVKPCGA